MPRGRRSRRRLHRNQRPRRLGRRHRRCGRDLTGRRRLCCDGRHGNFERRRFLGGRGLARRRRLGSRGRRSRLLGRWHGRLRLGTWRFRGGFERHLRREHHREGRRLGGLRQPCRVSDEEQQREQGRVNTHRSEKRLHEPALPRRPERRARPRHHQRQLRGDPILRRSTPWMPPSCCCGCYSLLAPGKSGRRRRARWCRKSHALRCIRTSP